MCHHTWPASAAGDRELPCGRGRRRRVPHDGRVQGYAGQFAREISNLLWQVPKELLLLLKTNDCLRSVDLALGQV